VPEIWSADKPADQFHAGTALAMNGDNGLAISPSRMEEGIPIPTTPAAKTNGPTSAAPDAFDTLVGKITSAILTKFQPNQVLPLEDNQLTVSQFKAQMESYLTASADAATAKATWESKETSRKALETGLKPLISGFHTLVGVAWGRTSSVLAVFGFTPAKVPAPATTAQKLARNTKASQTRAAKKASASTLAQTLTSIQGSKVAVTATVTPQVDAPVAAPTVSSTH
jgi:hypothetical protein